MKPSHNSLAGVQNYVLELVTPDIPAIYQRQVVQGSSSIASDFSVTSLTYSRWVSEAFTRSIAMRMCVPMHGFPHRHCFSLLEPTGCFPPQFSIQMTNKQCYRPSQRVSSHWQAFAYRNKRTSKAVSYANLCPQQYSRQISILVFLAEVEKGEKGQWRDCQSEYHLGEEA